MERQATDARRTVTQHPPSGARVAGALATVVLAVTSVAMMSAVAAPPGSGVLASATASTLSVATEAKSVEVKIDEVAPETTVELDAADPGDGDIYTEPVTEVRAAASCATVADGQCAVDLGGDLNHDGTATVTDSDQGNFDGLGWSYDADLLPPAGPVTWDGVTYHAPDPTGTAPNFVEARGQSILLPAGTYGSLRLVAASHNGAVATSLTVHYSDDTSTEVPITVGDWAGSAPTGATVVLDMPHRIRADEGIDGPSVRLFGYFLSLDNAKGIHSVELPDEPRTEVYAVTLGAPTEPVEVCNIHCDGRDPALAGDDRIAATATIGGRDVVLQVSDADNMAWASVGNGNPGDEVWLDRSFDGGRTWEPDGSRLGHSTIPSGQQGSRTLMYNVDNPDAREIGALRACGRANDEPEDTCTPWARSTVNAATPVDAAATALMQFYDQDRGLWDTTGWWNSANALTALIDYSQRTGSQAYRYAIATTFDLNEDTNFINEYVDDTGWWGLAWVRAYDLTDDQRYLDMARVTADYMNSYWDDHCDGGVWWRTDMTYKNAVTNELFIELSAALHNRLPGDTVYLARAQQGWNWFRASGMIDSQSLINDGLDSNCENNGQTTWTYNQGIILGGLVELHRATGDAGLLTEARGIADAATESTFLNPDGILREPCEPGCGADAPSFKGIFVRNLGGLDRALPGRPYRAYLARQADSAYASDRNNLDQYGLSWAGPFDSADAARQHAALDLLTATLEDRPPAARIRAVGRPSLRSVSPNRNRVRYRFEVRNVGVAPTGTVNLCARGPQRRVNVRGRRCVTRQVPPGATRQRPVVVGIKPLARGKLTRLRLVVRGPNVQNQQIRVRLRVRP